MIGCGTVHRVLAEQPVSLSDGISCRIVALIAHHVSTRCLVFVVYIQFGCALALMVGDSLRSRSFGMVALH